ncbi:MAG: beta-lactamase family protein [Gemmatimonadales bacterium]|nr:beta-lactamase family protein [Gemmatimonadales bacterium]
MTLVKSDWRTVTTFLDSAVAAGAAPGAVLGVSVAGIRFIHATGQLGADESQSVSSATVYDLASLTKVVGLTTALMLAVEEGTMNLDLPVQRYVPAFIGAGKDRVTLRMLLAHAGGLPPWRPLFRETTSRSEAFALVNVTPLGWAPGTNEGYSDLGIIVLTQAVEAVYRERLDSLLHRRLFQPLGMESVGYLPAAAARARIAPTELDPWRGRVLRGEVHDENTARLDGVSGHAGLFGSAPDLLTFSEWLIDGWRGGQVGGRTDASLELSDRPSIRPSVLREFTRRQSIIPRSSRALGWDTPTTGGSSGSMLSSSSFGHTGFTGTSLWIDPERRLAIVLLSNRVNPTRNNPRWMAVRGAIADLVMTTLEGSR